MPKKKKPMTVEVMMDPDNKGTQYLTLLREHRKTVDKWLALSLQAASGWPERITTEQTVMYKEAVALQDDVRSLHKQITALNMDPKVEHWMTPWREENETQSPDTALPKRK